ncbi:MAG: hypothetical protein KJ025_12740 [Burkholderiales bacterium]|nr:hypothetical protein [Burkholderiales bacterium]
MNARAALVAVALAAAAAAPAHAQANVQSLAGAWECRQPEHVGSTTPPILYIGVARSGGEVRSDLVEVDGFARAVSGMAKVSAADGGWTQVAPESGAPFLVQPGTGGAHGAMTVKRSPNGTPYRCLRLPYPKI